MSKKTYYREWLSCCGSGVMLTYDTVTTKNRREAIMNKPFGMYAHDESFENVELVKQEHLHLNDNKLSKIYGEKENE
jgi:hypothetical protein